MLRELGMEEVYVPASGDSVHMAAGLESVAEESPAVKTVSTTTEIPSAEMLTQPPLPTLIATMQ